MPVGDSVAFAAEESFATVRARLVAMRCADELAVLDRLTGDELMTLVRRECGWGASTDCGELRLVSSQGCASSTPQAVRGEVAA